MEPLAPFLKAIKTPRALLMRGFTMVEMLVALGIIVIVTAIVISGQANFNRSLILTDTAYTVAFSVRQAQSLGLSSRKFGSVQNAGYGVHFESATSKSYVLFADSLPVAPGNTQSGNCSGHTIASGLDSKPGNCVYDSVSEKVTIYNLGQGFTVSSFCGTDSTSTTRCSGSYLDSLDITFLRPNTQATIMGVRAGAVIPLSKASIYISSPDGTQTRCVSVTKVGQVAVGTTCP